MIQDGFGQSGRTVALCGERLDNAFKGSRLLGDLAGDSSKTLQPSLDSIDLICEVDYTGAKRGAVKCSFFGPDGTITKA